MNVAAGEGHPSARILIVGEAWGEQEERVGRPFIGRSGEELNKMLDEVGLSRSECYLTNLVNARPPYNDMDRWVVTKKKDITSDMVMLRDKYVKPIVTAGFASLLREIHLVQPNVIVALGNTALWALTGAWGITKWRGSQIRCHLERNLYPAAMLGPEGQPWSGKLIPTLHPAYVLRDFGSRPTVINDLKRVALERDSIEYSNEPKWDFVVRPSFAVATTTLHKILAGLVSGELEWIDFDLETRAGHIACAGLSWSATEAISIPFMCVEDKEGYWLPEFEAELVWLLHQILTHPRVKVRWQNGLYDAQYTYRHWHFVPRGAQDTMISHHSTFCGLKKSLAFQASMYCDHYVYWKDDGKTWAANMSEEQLWRYNCIDCVRTRECGEVEARTVTELGLEPVDAFQQKFFWPVLQCMQRGVRVDQKARARLAVELFDHISDREDYFRFVLGHALNPASPKQMISLFYEDLKQPIVYSKPKKGKPRMPTCGKEALRIIETREPILRPLIDAIREYRSLGVFLKNFVMAPLDVDQRMRTSYNICGTKTFRFASRKNAFGSGTNLQNIPKGDEAVLDDDEDEDDEEGAEVDLPDNTLHLPNIRKIFIPDPGFTIFDTDLSKADLRIVTWEADEPEMKAMLKAGIDPYVELAREFYKDPSISKLRPDGSDDPRYKTFKSFAHGTHYLGTPYGLASRLGLSTYQAEKTQAWYFSRFPRIKAWQTEFCNQLRARRYVENVFGYRRYYFDRIDEATCREAIAWVPQSTVALYINRIWMDIYEQYKHIWILLQVHDSLVGQFPTHRKAECLEQLKAAGQIILPYVDPLVIPVGIKTSEVSWGAC